jgi:cell division protein FtsI (penicillin-binding protein 3)
MNQKTTNRAIHQRKHKISGLFLLIVLGMLIFLASVLKTITTERRIPSHNKTIYDRSFRGSIISSDGYTLSASQKSYKAVVRAESIAPQKREVFIKLFSIYSGIPEETIRKRFKDKKGREKKGNIILSKTLDFQAASQLKSLAYKLRKLNVFRSIKTRSGIEVLYGLDIIEIGESRRFPKHDIMSPILGYVSKKEEKNYVRPKGQKGLEKRYEEHITSKKDGYFRGKRDVIGAVIHDKNSINIKRVDGLDLHLNIPLSLQRRIELMLDKMKQKIDADEILIGIMESHTGKVLALASTERYDPAHIRQQDIPALNPKFSEYPYEPGSVIKPLTLAVALDHHVVTPQSWFKTGYHKFQIGKRRFITDDEFFDSQTATDIIVHSSNIGISQIAWRLNGTEFRKGLLKFGLAYKSGIDLSRDLPGSIKPLHLLNNNMHRANTAYGYGMTATFAQLLKAYSAFNNDGVAVTPRIVDYLEDAKGNHYTLPPKIGDLQAVGKQAARDIHKILLEVVKRGTGVKAQTPGIEIGGKTGTAHIAKHGHYVREYHSSFYGFANDKKGHKYTIGVLVIRAKKYHAYFASQSAVPTFKKAVDILIDQGYLIPDPEALRRAAEQQAAKIPHTSPQSLRKKPAKKKSIKALFGIDKKKTIKKKPKIRKKPAKATPKPSHNQSTHELFEDLF